MSKFIINEIDREVNTDKTISTQVAIGRVKSYIIKKIDPTFPKEAFDDWCDSDSDEPFRWNKNSYHWL